MLKLRAVVPALALFLVVGCGGGVNEKFFEEAQARIDALRDNGVPSDSLSGARVALNQSRTHKERRQNALAKQHADALKAHLDRIEKYFNENVATLGPTIDAAKATATAAKAELTGFQVRKIDSTLAVVDSLRRVNRSLQANNIAQELINLLPSLREDEQRGTYLKRRIPGVWLFTDKLESAVVSPRDAAVERKEFTFGKDGRVTLIESKKGQSGEFLKEDWEFRSWGTYDYMGDTIVLMINRFAVVRQDFERIHMVDNNRVWKKEPGPRYDSAITDGSQNRTITYDDLVKSGDFRQTKKF